ncbi:MAG: hypothetical protein ACRDSZ_01985 [Pseudonocardiaceae bacterium]
MACGRAPGPACSPAIKDSIWDPQVAGLGWLVITRDGAIHVTVRR